MIARTANVELVHELIGEAIGVINTMFPCIVQSYDPINMKCDVRPISKFRDEVGNELEVAPILECPVSFIKFNDFYIRTPIKEGDIVYVGCCQEALENLIMNSENNINELSGVMKFRLTDAVVLGGLMTASEGRLSSSNTEDLLITNRNNNDKIVVKLNGGVEIETGTNVSIKTNQVTITSPETNISGNLTVGGDIKGSKTIEVSGSGVIDGISIKGHTHPGVQGGSSNTGGAQ